MWTYHVDSGRLFDAVDRLVGTGYSGHGAGINNPAMERDHDVGPIPRGRYMISPFFNDPVKGPIVAHLIPEPDTVDFGRYGFMLHGDNSAGNESASHGCIIMPHGVRAEVDASADHELLVV